MFVVLIFIPYPSAKKIMCSQPASLFSWGFIYLQNGECGMRGKNNPATLMIFWGIEERWRELAKTLKNEKGQGGKCC